MADANLARITRVLEDPLYVAVGFGVLGFQRAQVWRRSWQRRMMKMAGAAMADRLAGAVPDMAAGAASRLGPVAFGTASQAAEKLGQAAGEAVSRARPVLDSVTSEAADRLRPIAAQLGEHLPPEAKELIDAAGDVVADIPAEAREIVREAAAFGRLALQVLRAPASRPSYP